MLLRAIRRSRRSLRADVFEACAASDFRHAQGSKAQVGSFRCPIIDLFAKGTVDRFYIPRRKPCHNSQLYEACTLTMAQIHPSNTFKRTETVVQGIRVNFSLADTAQWVQ